MPNTYTNLCYHIVFSTKGREPFLSPTVRARMHEYLGGCLRSIGAVPLEVGGVADHVHLLASLKPTHAVSEVLRSIKKGSSAWIGEEIRAFRWQDGYSAFTVGHSDVEQVRRYIRGQEEHHRVRPFADEYRELLAEQGIEFAERYLL